MCVPVVTVQASGVANIDAFNTLTGDAKYLGAAYRDNYYLDIEETNVKDVVWVVMNGVANVLFSIIRITAYLVCSVFYHAINFDVTSLFAGQITTIQDELKKGVFDPLFTLACTGTGFLIIKKLLRRNTIGVFTEVLKIVFIVVLSIALVKCSSTVLKEATSIAKEVSLQSLLSLNNSIGGASTQQAFAEQAAGVLWVNLVHEPWKSFEFGNDLKKVEESKIELLLSKAYSVNENEANRQVLIDQLELGCFYKCVAGGRLGGIIVYLVPFLIKCLVFLAVALLQLYFQLQAVFLFILAPIVLLLALVPGYEMNIISGWMRKVLESQLSILIITLLMGLLIRTDSLMYGMRGKYGWLMVVFFQTALGIGLFLSRNQILHLASNTVHGGAGVQQGVNMISKMRDRGKKKRHSTSSNDTNSEERREKSARISRAVSRDKVQSQSSDGPSSTKHSITASDVNKTDSIAKNNAIPESVADRDEQSVSTYRTGSYGTEYETEKADASSVKRPRMDTLTDNGDTESTEVAEARPITYLGSGYDSSREILKERGLWTDDIEVRGYDAAYGEKHTANNTRGGGTVYESEQRYNDKRRGIRTQIENRDSDISRAVQRTRRDAVINSRDRDVIAERPVTNWKSDTVSRPYSVNTDMYQTTNNSPYEFNNKNTSGSASTYEREASGFKSEKSHIEEVPASNAEKTPRSKKNVRNQEVASNRRMATRTARRDTKDLSRRKVSVTDSASQSYERANMHMNRNKRPVIRTDIPEESKRGK